MMRISITSKSKLIVMSCLVGLLHGCATRTMTDDRINSVVKDKDGFRLVIGRKWVRIVEGGDWEGDTVLKQKSEYYRVPLDFSKNEIHLEPLVVNDKSAETMYDPVKNDLLPREISIGSEKKMNPDLFSNPDNYMNIRWSIESVGLDGYVYFLESVGKFDAVQILYNGLRCSVPLKSEWVISNLTLSNDGRSLAVFERNEAETLRRISVYNQCARVFSKEVEAVKLNMNEFYGFESQNGTLWFILKNQKHMQFFNSSFELMFTVDSEELNSNAYNENDTPIHKPIFDAEKQKLYWFSHGNSHPQDNPNLTMILTECDLVTKHKKSVLLKLGGPLH